MSVQAVLLPLFVQVILTFVLLFAMGGARVSCLRRRERRISDIAPGEPNWPPRVQQVSNAFHNQFQLPVLFYVLVLLALALRKADILFVVMAWLFVVSRIVHAFIHVTSNDVGQRFAAFLVGAVILALMWIIFMARIVVAL